MMLQWYYKGSVYVEIVRQHNSVNHALIEKDRHCYSIASVYYSGQVSGMRSILKIYKLLRRTTAKKSSANNQLLSKKNWE